MKIAQVTIVHPGTENRISFKESRALHQAGHDVHLIAPGPRHIDAFPHHEISPASHRLVRALTGGFQAWSRLKAINPDVVHAHDPELIPLGLAFRFRHKALFIFDAHENFSEQVASKFYLNAFSRPVVSAFARLLERLADRFSDAVVVAVDELKSTYFRNSRVVTVRNYPWVYDRARSDDCQVVAHEPPVIGYVGAISKDRGFHLMQELARRSQFRPKLILAGRFQPESLSDDLDDETVYLGAIPPSEVPNVVNSFDIGLCLLSPEPNYLKARSTKIYEYMMAGKPFLYSNFPSWVTEHGNDYGIAVDPQRIDEALRQLDCLLADSSGRGERGELAREMVESRFSFNVEARTLVSLYESLSKP